ncbi:MAG: hypothetical protein RLZZ175_717 [Bacteroidota bacterium]|jgi:predicted AAA+ superfamily ATPase
MLDALFYKSELLVRKHAKLPKRGIFNSIHWESKLIGIKGVRGIGKTTVLLQRLFDLKLPANEAIFISLDDWFFTQHTLVETAEYFIKQGGKYLFIDEVHKYQNWALQIKNLYDFYDLNIVFTGSSIIDIAKEEGDLSRRAVMYQMYGLSFREYLNIEYNFNFKELSLAEITSTSSISFAENFPVDFKPYKYFSEYLKSGYYPFFKEGKDVYYNKIQQVIRQVIEYDMAELKGFDIRNAKKMLQLLGVIAQNVPFKPNVQKLAEKMDMNRLTLQNYLVFLMEANLINLLYPSGISTAVLQKPEKIYFENTNLAYALGGDTNIGTIRETFVFNQLKQQFSITSFAQGDFLVDNKFVFEVGGKSKSNKQIESFPDSFRVLDDYDFTSIKNVIPIWLLGFLY